MRVNIDFTQDDRNLTIEAIQKRVEKQIKILKDTEVYLRNILEGTPFEDVSQSEIAIAVKNLMGNGEGLANWDNEVVEDIYRTSPDNDSIRELIDFSKYSTEINMEDFEKDFKSNNRRAMACTISDIADLYSEARDRLIDMCPSLEDNLDNDFYNDLIEAKTPMSMYCFAYSISKAPDEGQLELITKNAPDITIMQHNHLTANQKEVNIIIDNTVYRLEELQAEFVEAFSEIGNLGYATDISPEKKKALNLLNEAIFLRNEIIDRIDPLNGLTNLPAELDWSDTLQKINQKFDELILDISKEKLKDKQYYITSNSSKMDMVQVAYAALYLDDKVFNEIKGAININQIKSSGLLDTTEIIKELNRPQFISKKDKGMEETRVKEVTASRTLHELDNGLAYYNYEGNHFRVFDSFEDGEEWLKSRDESLVIEEFDDEDELDNYLENTQRAIPKP